MQQDDPKNVVFNCGLRFRTNDIYLNTRKNDVWGKQANFSLNIRYNSTFNLTVEIGTVSFYHLTHVRYSTERSFKQFFCCQLEDIEQGFQNFLNDRYFQAWVSTLCRLMGKWCLTVTFWSTETVNGSSRIYEVEVEIMLSHTGKQIYTRFLIKMEIWSNVQAYKLATNY